LTTATERKGYRRFAAVLMLTKLDRAGHFHVLARQMGGDAPLLAQIITLQTMLAAATMPIAIAWVS
jgi:predicted permease